MNEPWVEVHRAGDLVIHARPGEGGIRDLVAVGHVAAPPGVVYAVLSDYDRYAEFMPYTRETRVVRRAGARLTVYQRLSLPVVADRDYAMEVALTPGPGGAYGIAWTAVPDAVAVRPGCVRVRINTGSWELRPLDGGSRTRLTHTLRTHPGGGVPAWVASRSDGAALSALYRAIRERAGTAAPR